MRGEVALCGPGERGGWRGCSLRALSLVERGCHPREGAEHLEPGWCECRLSFKLFSNSSRPTEHGWLAALAADNADEDRLWKAQSGEALSPVSRPRQPRSEAD